MKFIAILLTLCLSANVFANENLVRSFEQEVDSHQYALTVEWDQIDQKFADAQVRSFLASIESLMALGLSTEEMLTVLEKRVSDKQVFSALRVKVDQAASAADQEELLRVIQDASSSLYAQGASWNGTAVLFYGGLGVLLVSYLAYTSWYNANYECVEWTSQSTHNVCRYEKKQ